MELFCGVHQSIERECYEPKNFNQWKMKKKLQWVRLERSFFSNKKLYHGNGWGEFNRFFFNIVDYLNCEFLTSTSSLLSKNKK